MRYQFVIISFLLALSPVLLAAQTIVLGTDKMNVAYLGVPNPIDVAVTNAPCSNVSVRTDNGQIVGRGCHCVFHPAERGKSELTVFVKDKPVAGYEIRVKELGKLLMTVDGRTEGYLTRGELVAMRPVAGLENCYYDTSFVITKYTIEVRRSKPGSAVYEKQLSTANGAILDDETEQVIGSLRHDDIVVLRDAEATSPGNKHIPLPSITFRVAY